MQNLGNVLKTRVKEINQSEILRYTKLTHLLSIKNIHFIVESVAKPGTLLFIILCLVYKFDIKKFHDIVSFPLYEKKIRGRKHHWEIDTCKYVKSVQCLDYLNKASIANIQYVTLMPGNGRPP